MKNIFSHPRIPYPGHSNIQQIDKDQKIMQNRYYNVPVKKKKYIYIYMVKNRQKDKLFGKQ